MTSHETMLKVCDLLDALGRDYPVPAMWDGDKRLDLVRRLIHIEPPESREERNRVDSEISSMYMNGFPRSLIAKQVGMTEEEVYRRLNTLRNNGYVRGIQVKEYHYRDGKHDLVGSRRNIAASLNISVDVMDARVRRNAAKLEPTGMMVMVSVGRKRGGRVG